MRREWIAWVCFLWVGYVHCIAYPCPTPSTVDTGALPSAPVFPTAYISGSGPFITNHWSEAVQLLRPTITPPTANPAQTNCPHLQSGLLNWHDPATWGGSVPADGQAVTIPLASSVLVSSCSVNSSAVFGTITIPTTSALVFADADISFRATGFQVFGALSIGSPTCRLRHSVKITLHGSRSGQSLPTNEWTKGIYVRGSFDAHGALYTPTWTRLAKTAHTNDTIIYIQDIVNWQPGQTIVITTTELRDARDWHRNEEGVINNVYLVTTNVAAIELTAPLLYNHYGGAEYQAEVALLSRNVVIQGDEDNSEPTDTYPVACYDWNGDKNSTYPCNTTFLTGFGGHVFVAGNGAIGRFEGVELYRMGQTNQLARYPLHFHMVGTSQGPDQTLISDCSVHRSFFRCYAIHGTNNVTIIQNTAYDAIAHCYFLEDGVEENSTFAYNFGAHVHPLGRFMEISQGIGGNGQSFGSQNAAYYTDNPNLIHTSDMAAAVFYITNAYNTFIGNAASGGWTGFSFPNLPLPIKLHANTSGVKPMNRPIQRFQGNSAHSTGYWWGSAAGVYVGGLLSETTNPGSLTYTHGREVTRDTCLYYASGSCPTNWKVPMIFLDTKVFLANRGIQDWGNTEDIIRFEGHDLGLSANVFGSVWLDQLLVNCRSNNTVTLWNGCNWKNSNFPWGYCNARDYQFFRGAVGFQFYDTGMRHIITNSIFRNCAISQFKQCQGCSFASFELLTHSDQFLPDHMQTTYNLTYQNCDQKNLWRFTVAQPSWDAISGRLQSWLDMDGSASPLSVPGMRTLLGSNRSSEWYKVNEECYGTLDEMYVCPLNPLDSVVSITAHYDSDTESTIGPYFCSNGNHAYCPVIGSVTHFGRPKGSGLKLGGNPKITGPMISEAGGWFLEYFNGTPAVLNFSTFQIEPGVSVLLAIPYPSGTNFTIAAIAANWCNWKWATCQFNLSSTTSVEAVRNGGGDLYYWDSNAGVLFVKLIQPPNEGDFAGLGKHPYNKTWTLSNFTRAGITLVSPTYNMYYRVIAECPGQTGLDCPYVDRAVPPASGCGTCGPKSFAPSPDTPAGLSPSSTSTMSPSAFGPSGSTPPSGGIPSVSPPSGGVPSVSPPTGGGSPGTNPSPGGSPSPSSQTPGSNNGCQGDFLGLRSSLLLLLVALLVIL